MSIGGGVHRAIESNYFDATFKGHDLNDLGVRRALVVTGRG
jgi:hypothetical protein